MKKSTGLLFALLCCIILIAAALQTPPLPQPGRFAFRSASDPIGFVPEASSQDPVPPVPTYNPDGTLQAAPVEFSRTFTYNYPSVSGPAGTITFIQKKLTVKSSPGSDSIDFLGITYPVYSTVPENMTIAYGYQHPLSYFDQNQVSMNWSVGTILPPDSSAKINCGSPSAKSPQTTQTGDGSQVILAQNNSTSCAGYSRFYLPYLPNTKAGDGLTDLDHIGLTENIAWNSDEYIQIGNDPNFYPALEHLFQYGWSFDPRNVGQALQWNNLTADGGNVSTPFFMGDIQPNQGNSLLWTIQGKYWCTDYPTCTNKDFTKIQGFIAQDPVYPYSNPTPWLRNGAFVAYQATPGFQKNLLREQTPAGAFTVLNNTSGLFVRTDGSVEIPADGSGNAYPIAIQTWDAGQQFNVVNLTSGAISSTFDSYPGDEVYYLGNTYLPNQAGPITKWTYYPWTSMASGGTFAPFYSNGTIGHIFDQRRSDGWLGLKNDLMENVLAWNDSTSPGFPNPQIVGGQARKPYMIGANDQFGQIGQIPKTKATPFPAAGAEIRHTMLLQHSNSYLLWRVQNSQGQSDMTNKAYQASLYMQTPAGTFLRIATVGYTFQQNWGFADNSAPVTWTANKGDGYGAWVPTLSVNPQIVNNQNLPVGWVFSTDQSGLGILAFPGGFGGNVSIKCNQAIWNSGNSSINWTNQISWNDPANPTQARQNVAGQNAIECQLVGNASDSRQFVVALEENGTGIGVGSTGGGGGGNGGGREDCDKDHNHHGDDHDGRCKDRDHDRDHIGS